MQLLGHPDKPVEICQGFVSGAGPSHQQDEISARVLGLAISTTSYNASVTSQGVGSLDSAGGQEITGYVRCIINTEVSNLSRQDNSHKAGNLSGSTVSSPPSSSDKQSGSISILHRGGETVLPPNGEVISGSLAAADIVDARNARVQWADMGPSTLVLVRKYT